MFSSVVFVLGLDFANRPLSILKSEQISALLAKTKPAQKSEHWLLMASAETNSLPKGRNVLRLSSGTSVFKL